ncbi:phosphoenolpyruvate--protein phosphotransferase [Blautia sp. OF03-15BH]|uniref:phosphoenolpyruvate--protein phosphotransferase n=1 Tax=Blautia sp. OF03-15BH TaxID=2292287 RepID=UPI000E47592C|nr:phosphoenolpyruvate--protein phosphotransferase [Blautia sp. OF03-15BH]RGY00086.1 phosphoenolpyruvate--protein phosphotransferase [Blautia sp. OF03-15BH]
MEQYQGRIIVQKIAIGRIWFYTKEEQSVKRYKVEDTEKEWDRYEAAKDEAVRELNGLKKKAVRELGEINAAIFEAHAMMLEDRDYSDSVKNIIETQSVNAEYAVAATGDNFARMFSGMEDEYFRAKAEDVQDISERVIGILSGRRKKKRMEQEPVIVVAEDLAPSETVQMDKSQVLGFVTRQGSSQSHTAILARTMNLPALIGIPVKAEWDGKLAAIDGINGILYVDPDEETLEKMQLLQKEEQERQRLLTEWKDRETVTKSGRKIRLCANVGSIADVAGALQNGAEGIGLFRSEFLFLTADHCPTEEEQFQTYRLAAEMMAGKTVIIRTIDIGADKRAAYMEKKPEPGKEDSSLYLEEETNPAMGLRGIRLSLEKRELFKTQLRAILRAGAFGEISVLYPLIASVEEFRKAKALLAEVEEELKALGIPFGKVRQGVMIETPAAAILSDLLAEEAEFFSIGTNDLSQYTMAVDRENPRTEEYFDPHHPALLRLIRYTVKNAGKAGIPVGICGDLGGDETLTEFFVKEGVDELSVPPSRILPLREKIKNLD